MQKLTDSELVKTMHDRQKVIGKGDRGLCAALYKARYFS